MKPFLLFSHHLTEKKAPLPEKKGGIFKCGNQKGYNILLQASVFSHLNPFVIIQQAGHRMWLEIQNKIRENGGGFFLTSILRECGWGGVCVVHTDYVAVLLSKPSSQDHFFLYR